MLDLLVLGAGPAGCAAAIQARRAGLGVVLLDAAERPRPTPGETLHPGIESIFATLGVRDAVLANGFHRHRGVWIEWDGSRRFEAYGEDACGPWLGFQADRQELQGILFDRLIDLGVTTHRPVVPGSLIVEGSIVRGVVVNGCELRARWTADATGRRAWLARKLGLAASRCSPPLRTQFGWRGHRGDDQPCVKATRNGWRWEAPLGGGRAAWVDVTAGSREIASGADVSWRVHRASAGFGYFLLGDAAATLDPLSSHGVLRALMSGILCAHCVAANVCHSAAASEAIDRFTTWTSGQFDHDANALTTLYRRHPSAAVADLFADPQFDLRVAV